MSDVKRVIKTNTFIIRDFYNKDICELQFNVATPCSFKEYHAKFAAFLIEHMDEPAVSLIAQASAIIKEWHKKGKFPDGTFFFMKTDKEPGFRVSYMYKKELVNNDQQSS